MIYRSGSVITDVIRLGQLELRMNKPDSTSIETSSQLRELLGNSCIDVVWFVRCEIGPDWIGGGRDVQLFQNGNRLSGTCCENLISAIIAAASIPSESSDSVISGEGEITLHDEKLTLEFEWNDTVPYDDTRNSGHGSVELEGITFPPDSIVG
jgi:hypothetical protein